MNYCLFGCVWLKNAKTQPLPPLGRFSFGTIKHGRFSARTPAPRSPLEAWIRLWIRGVGSHTQTAWRRCREWAPRLDNPNPAGSGKKCTPFLKAGWFRRETKCKRGTTRGLPFSWFVYRYPRVDFTPGFLVSSTPTVTTFLWMSTPSLKKGPFDDTQKDPKINPTGGSAATLFAAFHVSQMFRSRVFKAPNGRCGTWRVRTQKPALQCPAPLLGPTPSAAFLKMVNVLCSFLRGPLC